MQLNDRKLNPPGGGVKYEGSATDLVKITVVMMVSITYKREAN